MKRPIRNHRVRGGGTGSRRRGYWRYVGAIRDVISYSASISACEKGQQWEQALGLLQESGCCQLAPCAISYSTSISACEKGRQWEHAINLS